MSAHFSQNGNEGLPRRWPALAASRQLADAFDLLNVVADELALASTGLLGDVIDPVERARRERRFAALLDMLEGG
jgi:hypothetical protein